MAVTLHSATIDDVPLIRQFIRDLADYERLADAAVVTEDDLRASLFGERPAAEVIIAACDGAAAGFALFFHNYSTFLGRKGLYLEDLFVRPEFRGRGIGVALFRELARIAVERNCGRIEWWVLDWNESAIEFYKSRGAEPMSDWTVFRLDEARIRALAAS